MIQIFLSNSFVKIIKGNSFVRSGFLCIYLMRLDRSRVKSQLRALMKKYIEKNISKIFLGKFFLLWSSQEWVRLWMYFCFPSLIIILKEGALVTWFLCKCVAPVRKFSWMTWWYHIRKYILYTNLNFIYPDLAIKCGRDCAEFVKNLTAYN